MHNKLMEDLSSELGKSFGKVLRGEANAFEDFGKTMAKNLTDSLGKTSFRPGLGSYRVSCDRIGEVRCFRSASPRN